MFFICIGYVKQMKGLSAPWSHSSRAARPAKEHMHKKIVKLIAS